MIASNDYPVYPANFTPPMRAILFTLHAAKRSGICLRHENCRIAEF